MLQIKDRIKIIQEDIVKLEVDAIVNAANPSLLGGGGVDGAIHKAAGPRMLEECKKLKGFSHGEAKITKRYLLPVKWVIHTAGPIWQDGSKEEDKTLASCYRKSLELAREYSIKSIAFPAMSTGAYGFPSKRAARIAVKEISRFLQEKETPETVFLVCFNAQKCLDLQEALKARSET